jgi:hypothetical protein
LKTLLSIPYVDWLLGLSLIFHKTSPKQKYWPGKSGWNISWTRTPTRQSLSLARARRINSTDVENNFSISEESTSWPLVNYKVNGNGKVIPVTGHGRP